MWKTRFFSWYASTFLSTTVMWKRISFEHGIFRGTFAKVVHRKIIHIPQPLWKIYRQELILEVMSRMVFFRVSSPLCTPLSTF